MSIEEVVNDIGKHISNLRKDNIDQLEDTSKLPNWNNLIANLVMLKISVNKHDNHSILKRLDNIECLLLKAIDELEATFNYPKNYFFNQVKEIILKTQAINLEELTRPQYSSHLY